MAHDLPPVMVIDYSRVHAERAQLALALYEQIKDYAGAQRRAPRDLKVPTRCAECLQSIYDVLATDVGRLVVMYHDGHGEADNSALKDETRKRLESQGYAPTQIDAALEHFGYVRNITADLIERDDTVNLEASCHCRSFTLDRQDLRRFR